MPITDADIERSQAIIIQCDRLLKEQGVEFELFVYDIYEHIMDEFGNHEKYLESIETLAKAGLSIHFLSDVITDYDDNLDFYTHGRHDRHPNVRSNQIIASYFAGLYTGSAPVVLGE